MAFRPTALCLAISCAIASPACGRQPTQPTTKQGTASAFGVTAIYPPSWVIQPTGAPTTVNISNVDRLSNESDAALASESLFQIRVITDANPARIGIDQWFEEYFDAAARSEILTRTSAVVGGRPAVRIEVVEAGGAVAHFYVALNSDVIELSYRSSQTVFADQYQEILNSVTFER